MLLKGIIVGYNGNKYKVRIPTFEVAGNAQKYIVDATVAYEPGNIKGLLIDDVVYVGFENNDIDRPVILGKLLTNNEEKASAFYKAADLEVSGSTKLSSNTQIGDINYNDIYTAVIKSA